MFPSSYSFICPIEPFSAFFSPDEQSMIIWSESESGSAAD